MKEKRYDGFVLSIVFYLIVMLLALILSTWLRAIISPFIQSPAIAETGGKLIYLVRTVYPVCMVILHLFVAAATFFGSWFVAKKVAFRHETKVPKFKKVYQICAVCLITVLFQFYYTIPEQSALVHWYTGAVLSDITGTINFDAADILTKVSAADIVSNNYIIESLDVGGFQILSVLLTAVYMGVLSYFGRKKGEEAGIAARIKHRESITGNKDISG